MLTKFFQLVLGDLYSEMDSEGRFYLSLSTIGGMTIIVAVILLLNGDMIEDILTLALIGGGFYYIVKNNIGLSVTSGKEIVVSVNQKPSTVTKISEAQSIRSNDDTKVVSNPSGSVS